MKIDSKTKETVNLSIEKEIYITLDKISKVLNIDVEKLISSILQNELKFFKSDPGEFFLSYTQLGQIKF